MLFVFCDSTSYFELQICADFFSLILLCCWKSSYKERKVKIPIAGFPTFIIYVPNQDLNFLIIVDAFC